MKLSTKLFAAMGTLTVIILVVGLFSMYQMSGINGATSTLARTSMPSVLYIGNIDTISSDFRQIEILHVYSEDRAELDSYDRQLAQLWSELEENLKNYHGLPRTVAEDREYELLVKGLKEYKVMSEQTTELSRKLQTQAAIELLLKDSRVIYDAAATSLHSIATMNADGAMRAAANADATYESAKTLISALLLIGALIAIGLSAFIVRSVLHQLGTDPGILDSMARKVAGGDLDVKKDNSAVGVYASILAMVESLKINIHSAQEESLRAREESVKAQESSRQAEIASAEAQAKSVAMLRAADQLEAVANIVSSASTELSAQIEQSSHGASQQSDRMAETATAMEEMNSTVMEVAKNAGSAYDVSGATRQKAESGAIVVSKAVASIRRVQGDSLVLKDDMQTLSENAQAITQIMNVISDIADQTNLLALNAAIEAARAGDAGRGFAVVADEVRNLAEKTMASTTDVGNAIKAIQQSASKSMAQVDVAVKNIEEATIYANESGNSLSEIVQMVDQTADQVRAIAAASEQQSAASEEINHSISQVNTIASETAQAMGEASKAVSDLAHQANTLGKLIEEMKRG